MGDKADSMTGTVAARLGGYGSGSARQGKANAPHVPRTSFRDDVLPPCLGKAWTASFNTIRPFYQNTKSVKNKQQIVGHITRLYVYAELLASTAKWYTNQKVPWLVSVGMTHRANKLCCPQPQQVQCLAGLEFFPLSSAQRCCC
jgi:hypothetical protein